MFVSGVHVALINVGSRSSVGAGVSTAHTEAHEPTCVSKPGAVALKTGAEGWVRVSEGSPRWVEFLPSSSGVIPSFRPIVGRIDWDTPVKGRRNSPPLASLYEGYEDRLAAVDQPRLKRDTGDEGNMRDGPARASSLLASKDVSARRDVPVRTKRISSKPKPSELGVNFVRGKLNTVKVDERWFAVGSFLAGVELAAVLAAQLTAGYRGFVKSGIEVTGLAK